ncbi:MAG TPA: MBL fold metallo-hydrolase, partial [Polyangiaceae bacterium]
MPVLTGLRLERARASKQYRDGKFHNVGGVGLTKESAKPGTIGEFVFGGKARVPHAPLPVERPHEAWAKAIGESKLRITWLGHSTLLIESGNLRVLTDPVFGDRASPVSFAGPKRFHPVPATITELPKVDAVLLSHDHYDHLCEASFRELARMEVPVVTSLGVGARLESFGVRPALIHEVDWWESIALFGNRLSFMAVPAQHFSGRGLVDRNDTLWSSFVIETDHHKLFFSGDTGLHDGMQTIGRKFGRFDAVMLEIGAWNQAWGTIHLGPENALK